MNPKVENQLNLLQAKEKTLEENNEYQFECNYKKRAKKLRGILIGLAGAFFLALSSILNRKATFVTGSEQIIVRYLMQLTFMLMTAYYNKVNIFGLREHRKRLLACGTALALAGISLNLSVKYIDPSDTEALHSTRLVMISILARIFLKEKLTIVDILCLILTLAGVLFITQPSFLVQKFS
jgi:drug/metabolite transporter (DMT)-like permease